MKLNEKEKNAIMQGEKIGNMIFTDDGIINMIPYQEVNNCPEEINWVSLHQDLHKIIRYRMNKCVRALNEHINDISCIASREAVYWKDGHFFVETYRTMERYVKSPILEVKEPDGCNLREILSQALKGIAEYSKDSSGNLLFIHTLEELFNLCVNLLAVL